MSALPKSIASSRRALLLGAAALLAGTHLPTPAKALTKSMRVGFFELPPHASMVDGQPVGPAVEYLRLVAQEMQVQAQFNMMPLSRLLGSDEVDLILMLGRNPEREKRLSFVSQPLLTMQGGVVVRTESRLKAVARADDLLGLVIGAYSDGYRGAIMRDPRLTLFQMSSPTLTQRALQMLTLNRLDAFYSPDAMSLAYQLDELSLSTKLRLVRFPSDDDALYPAFTQAGSLQLQQRFEAAFGRVGKRMPYREFLQQHLEHTPRHGR